MKASTDSLTHASREPHQLHDKTEHLARLLYMQAPISNITVFITAGIFYLILSSRVESNLTIYWVLCLSSSALYRLSLWYRRKKNPQLKSPSTWINHYIFGSALVGCSWSIIYPLINMADDLIVFAALLMLTFGILGASVAILAASMTAFIVYTYPIAIMLGYCLLQFQENTYHWLAFALSIYVLMITLFARNSNRNALNSILLQQQNQLLIDQLNLEIDQRETMIEQRTTQIEEKNNALIKEVNERKQTEQFQAKQRSILELISRGTASLEIILKEIVLLAESQTTEMRGSILLLEGKRLRLGASPSMPDDYNKLIDGLEIGPNIGSCGTAAFTSKRVIVKDVQSDPLWSKHSQLGMNYNFASCWSEPILDSSHEVLGTFALYHHQQVSPSVADVQLIEAMAQIAGIAIERSITEKRLRQSAEVFQSTLEGVIITDHNVSILDVNKAFEEITGYSRHEVIGRNPRMLRSEKHEARFYRDIWQALNESGQWRGEVWNQRKNGDVYPEWLNISCIYDDKGKPANYIAVFSDITSIKKSEEKLDHLAHHDPLTGLPNRLLLNTHLEQAVKQAHRQQSVFAVLFLDLDRFKNINDSLGHKAGDELLQQLAERIQSRVRISDTIARISGDEFVVILMDTESAAKTAVTVEKIMAVFNDSFTLDDHEIRITASIGISLYPTNGETPAQLLQNADTAMYRAKDEGRNSYQFYTKEMTSSTFERVVLENALRMALSRNEFHLNYQPQFYLLDQSMIGAEALIRWHHPELGIISPAKFIPLAEENGLIHEIGEWVLKNACLQGKKWLDAGFDFGRISVNVARPQLQHSNFVNKVQAILGETELPADKLELEVTESFIMQNSEHAIQQLEALKLLGLNLAIDDFGTGYSSMSYLKLLPIQKLKIDQSFIHDIPFDSNDMAISEAVIALGKALGLQVIAEGVETDLQVDFLTRKGCQLAQGYLYCHPISAEEIESIYHDDDSGFGIQFKL